jgi:glycerol-3-phosphate dehydrogenase
LRRTHLAWFTPDHSRHDIGRIAEVMGSELGWSTTQREAEMAAHEHELLAERL